MRCAKLLRTRFDRSGYPLRWELAISTGVKKRVVVRDSEAITEDYPRHSSRAPVTFWAPWCRSGWQISLNPFLQSTAPP